MNCRALTSLNVDTVIVNNKKYCRLQRLTLKSQHKLYFLILQSRVKCPYYYYCTIIKNSGVFNYKYQLYLWFVFLFLLLTISKSYRQPYVLIIGGYSLYSLKLDKDKLMSWKRFGVKQKKKTPFNVSTLNVLIFCPQILYFFNHLEVSK